MSSADLDDTHKGAWRDRLGWVGGPTLHRAGYVAAHLRPHRHPRASGRVRVNGTRHAPGHRRAPVHAQFETIHPFADEPSDGVGSIGWMLNLMPWLAIPPPISVAFLRDVGGYLSGLTQFRTVGPDEWVHWFARTVEHAATFAPRR